MNVLAVQGDNDPFLIVQERGASVIRAGLPVPVSGLVRKVLVKNRLSIFANQVLRRFPCRPLIVDRDPFNTEKLNSFDPCIRQNLTDT